MMALIYFIKMTREWGAGRDGILQQWTPWPELIKAFAGKSTVLLVPGARQLP